ncbi:hypothetical protein [Paenibacillus chitinolyticus]
MRQPDGHGQPAKRAKARWAYGSLLSVGSGLPTSPPAEHRQQPTGSPCAN